MKANNYLLQTLRDELDRRHRKPRKIWLILKGGTLPLVLDSWNLETYDKELIGYIELTPVFTKGHVVVDRAPNGEVHMMVDIEDVVAVKFYEQ